MKAWGVPERIFPYSRLGCEKKGLLEVAKLTILDILYDYILVRGDTSFECNLHMAESSLIVFKPHQSSLPHPRRPHPPCAPRIHYLCCLARLVHSFAASSEHELELQAWM
eukprot:SAG31_NODE_830_length_11688_cov_35.424023_2_plen_110_part_00